MARKPLSYQLAVILLDGVDGLVSDLRDEGRSWESIARELWAVTAGKIDVTGQTVRSWYPAAA